MIQVLERTDEFLTIIVNSPGIALKDIVKEVQLNKTTVFNILKSLCILGYVSQQENGGYILGNKFLELSQKVLAGQTVSGLSQQIAVELAEKTRESGIITVLRQNELVIIAKQIFAQGVIVNTSLFGCLPHEKTASGRVFIAYLDKKRQMDFLKNCLSDSQGSDPEKELEQLKDDIAEIRRRGIAIQPVYQREAYAFAVPVFDPDGEICASLGVNIPAIRYSSRVETEIEETMKSISIRLGESLGFALKKFDRTKQEN